MRIVRRFDFSCRLKHEQCEPGCNYFVNTLLKEITSTTTISSQVVRPPTSKGAFLYDDFEHSRNRCSARCVVLSPRKFIPEQPDSSGLDGCAWRRRSLEYLAFSPSGHHLLPFNFAPMRKSMISAPVFKGFRKVMPPMSRTEKEAIDAGTTWWEGDLFQGNPDWKKLHNYPQPRLTAEEQAFIDGPVEEAAAWRTTLPSPMKWPICRQSCGRI
jgi:acyl-CoA dehydrogenase